MVLYFENSKGDRRVISNPSEPREMWKDISSFLKEHNFKSYYTRIVFGKDEWTIDVGSHVEFFIVTDFTEDDYLKIGDGVDEQD